MVVSEEIALEDSAPLTIAALLHVCIPGPGSFIPGSVYLRPWAEVSPGAAAKASLRGKEGKHLKTLFPTLTQYPVLLHSKTFSIVLCSPPHSQVPVSIKVPEPFIGSSLHSE